LVRAVATLRTAIIKVNNSLGASPVRLQATGPVREERIKLYVGCIFRESFFTSSLLVVLAVTVGRLVRSGWVK
jgi:hypothetical protein